MLAFACVAPDRAGAQQADSAGDAGVPNNGQDFTRPQNLFQLRYVFETAPGSGSAPDTIRTVTTDRAVFRTDFKVDLTSQWTLALRGDLPVVAKNPLTAANPTGAYEDGLGDADVQAALIKELDSHWAAGAGLRLIAPTGFDDLTSGKWRVDPVAGARYSLPDLSPGSYVEALVRYDVSFAGDPSKKNISNLQLAPMFNVDLPDRWFVTLYPDTEIRINYGDPVTGQTGRLFLPVDVMAGKTVAADTTLSLEVSVPVIKDYPVYDFKTVARFNLKF